MYLLANGVIDWSDSHICIVTSVVLFSANHLWLLLSNPTPKKVRERCSFSGMVTWSYSYHLCDLFTQLLYLSLLHAIPHSYIIRQLSYLPNFILLHATHCSTQYWDSWWWYTALGFLVWMILFWFRFWSVWRTIGHILQILLWCFTSN